MRDLCNTFPLHLLSLFNYCVFICIYTYIHTGKQKGVYLKTISEKLHINTSIPKLMQNSARFCFCYCSVSKLCLTLCNPMDCSTPGFTVLHHLHELTQTLVQCLWCYPTISSSVTSFFSCPRSFPASGSFPISQLFVSSGQGIGTSASILPVNIQGWPPCSPWMGLLRVFSSTTIWKHQFFNTQPSLWFTSHICTWLRGRVVSDSLQPCGL